MAGLNHQWSPTVFSKVWGGYASYELPTEAQSATNYLTSTKYWMAGTQLGWNPVKGLLIAVEYQYYNAKNNIATANLDTGTLIKSSDAHQARLRVRRDF